MLSREQLLTATHLEDGQVFDRSIDVQILRLRRKLEIDPTAPELIKTERGVGYVFTAPVHEVLTVISGTFRMGMGETADQRKAQLLPAGSFFALPPGTAHYVFIDEETVVQISTVGPWELTYIYPKDDPRPKSQ